jgi:hypothetical protein
MTSRSGRDPHDITPAEFTAACSEMEALVRERLPERFYRRMPRWRIAATALVARATTTLQSVALLAEHGRPSDATALMRVVYEEVITFCWLMIDPAERTDQWAEHATAYRLKLHNEAKRYPGARVLNEAEAEAARAAKLLPPLDQRATEVDEYWGARSDAFRDRSTEGDEHMLTMRGLYTGLYRVTSRGQHAQLDAMDAAIDHTDYPWQVVLEDRGDPTFAYLALPLVGLMLAAGAERLGWPDEQKAKGIVDALMRESD